MPAQNRYSHQTPASAVYWQWWIGKKTVWVAGLSEGTAFRSASSSTPSVHPNKPAQTPETDRAVDTNGQAHLATRVHWGPLWQPQSATWYSICQLPLLPLHCHRQREREKQRGGGLFSKKSNINHFNHRHISSQLFGDIHIHSVTKPNLSSTVKHRRGSVNDNN